MVADLNVSVADEIGCIEYGVSADVDATAWSNDERRPIVSSGRIADREPGIALRLKRRKAISRVDINVLAQVYIAGDAAGVPVVFETTYVAHRNQICGDVLVHRRSLPFTTTTAGLPTTSAPA